MSDVSIHSERGAAFFGMTPEAVLPKKEFTQSEVLGAFSFALNGLAVSTQQTLHEQGLDSVWGKWQETDPAKAKLAPAEKTKLQSISDPAIKERLAEYHAVHIATQLTDVEHGEDRYGHQFTKDGQTTTIQEGVPVEGLLNWLHDEIRSVRDDGALAKKDWDEKMIQLVQYGKMLSQYSSELIRTRDTVAMALPKTEANDRLAIETDYVNGDPLRDSGDKRKNTTIARQALATRRVLTLPKGGAPEPEPEPEPEPTPEPTPQTTDEVRFTVAVLNRTLDPYRRAQILTERELSKEMRSGSAGDVRNWLRKIGQKTFREYYRQSYMERSVKAMIDQNNSYLDIDVMGRAFNTIEQNRAEEKTAGLAKIAEAKTKLRTGMRVGTEQFVEAAGPVKALVVDEVIKPIFDRLRAGQAVSEKDVQDLLRDFAQRNVNHADAAVRSQIEELFGKDATKFGVVAQYFGTDMLEVTKQMVEHAKAHHEGLEALAAKTRIILGNTQWAGYTEEHFNWVDRTVAGLRRNRVGALFANPVGVGLGASLLTGVLIRAPRSVAQRLIPGMGSLMGGAFAGYQRYAELKRDIAVHRRERAWGAEAGPTRAEIDASLAGKNWLERQIANFSGIYRRADLEKFALSTATLEELEGGGGTDLVRGNTRRGIDELRQALIATPADANARADLISRLAELQARQEVSAEVAETYIQPLSGVSEEIVSEAITNNRESLATFLLAQGVTNDEIAAAVTQWKDILANDYKTKQDVFRSYARGQALGAGAFGAAVSFGFTELWGGLFGGGGGGATDAEHFQSLYRSGGAGGAVPLSDHHIFITNPQHDVAVYDTSAHQQVPLPGMKVTQEGNIIVNGTLDKPWVDEVKAAGIDVRQTQIDYAKVFNGTFLDKTPGHLTSVPVGTHWVQGTTNHWNLIANDSPNLVLVNDAQFSNTGHLVSFASLHQNVKFDPPTQVPLEVRPGAADTAWLSQLRTAGTIDHGGYHFTMTGNNLHIFDSNHLEVTHNDIALDGDHLRYIAPPTNAIPDKLVTALHDTGLIQNTNEVYPNVHFVDAETIGRIDPHDLANLHNQYNLSSGQAGFQDFTDNVHHLAAGKFETPVGHVQSFDSGEAIYIHHPEAHPLSLVGVDGSGNLVLDAHQFFDVVEVAKIQPDGQHVQIMAGSLAGEVRPISGIADAASIKQHIGEAVLYNRDEKSIIGAPGDVLNAWTAIKDAMKTHPFDDLGADPAAKGALSHIGFFGRLSPYDPQAVWLPLTGTSSHTAVPTNLLNYFFLNPNGPKSQFADLRSWVHLGFVKDPTSTNLAREVVSIANHGPTEVLDMKIHPTGLPETIFGEQTNVAATGPFIDRVNAQVLVPPHGGAGPFPFVPSRSHPLGPVKQKKPPKREQPEIPPYGYYGRPGGYYDSIGARRRLTDLGGTLSEQERQEQALPYLLPGAFDQWAIPETERQRILGLTPPEQMAWLQAEAARRAIIPSTQQPPSVPTSSSTSTSTVTSGSPIGINALASALGVTLPPPTIISPPPSASPPPSTTPPPTTPPMSPSPRPSPSSLPTTGLLEQDLTLYIADENNSPVEQTGRANAVRRAEQFISLGDIEEAERRGGLTKVESADLFKDMLGWLGRQNLIDISRDDPSFDQTTFKDVDYYAKEYAWGDTIEGRKLANSVLRFLNQSGGKYNVMGKGDKAANLNVVFAAFDSMKDLPLVPRSTP